MSIIDIEKIVNGTPEKVLLNGYDQLKNNYTRDAAAEYSKCYKNQPLSFIIENSDHIFIEPYFGLPFYESIITNPNYCLFTQLKSEADKVSEYLNDHEDMPEDQRALYENLANKIDSLFRASNNVRVYATLIETEVDESFEANLSDMLFDYCLSDKRFDYCNQKCNSDDIVRLFQECHSTMIISTYLPFVLNTVVDRRLNDIANTIINTADISSDNYSAIKWKDFTCTAICVQKLFHDSVYLKAVMNTPASVRNIFEFINKANIASIMNSITTVEMCEEDVIFNDPFFAVNSIFDDITEDVDNSSDHELRDIVSEMYSIYAEAVLDVVGTEHSLVESADAESTKYPLFESTTLSGIYDEAVNMINSFNDELVEEESEDTDDFEVSDDDLKPDNTGKKIKAPKQKNRAIKIQNKFMDKEAKQLRRHEKIQQKGREISNAAKAAGRLPLNVVKDIQKAAKAVDELDDQRRKHYMNEPGFRKKWFRNLKLAILYGSAANVKLALVPVVMSARHFSKQKDRRIRNELVREINTDISITEEKIQDATARQDDQEKYRLMRIRDQLKAELVRVRMNSKYV